MGGLVREARDMAAIAKDAAPAKPKPEPAAIEGGGSPPAGDKAGGSGGGKSAGGRSSARARGK
jgi:hypothetical protein